MSLVLARVDDRLIHGQVVVGWARALEADAIVVADDGVAADPMQRMLLPMAVPPQIHVDIWSIQEAARRFNEGELGPNRVILLFASLRAALDFARQGGRLPGLNVGGLRLAPGRNSLSVSVAVGPEDADSARALEALGVPIELRMLPVDEPEPFLDLLAKVPGL